MVRTLLGVAFIGVIGTGAVYLAVRPTIARSSALAGLLKPQDGVTFECDDNVPITSQGATFTCRATGNDGSTAAFELTMDRDGTLASRRISATPATHPGPAKSGDPWNL